MYELEVKYCIQNQKDILNRLSSFAKLIKKDTIVDTYYIQNNSTHQFRFREGANSGLVTIKSDNMDSDEIGDTKLLISICKENEFTVSDPSAFKLFLNMIPVEILGIVTKQREIYSYQDVRIEMNILEKEKYYIEIEVKCEKHDFYTAVRYIEDVVELLGLKSITPDTSRYINSASIITKG